MISQPQHATFGSHPVVTFIRIFYFLASVFYESGFFFAIVLKAIEQGQDHLADAKQLLEMIDIASADMRHKRIPVRR